MSPLPAWPALDFPQPGPASLAYQRAVWGKAHGAESDFRWIARSAGFHAGDGLARELLLGSEDAPPGRGMAFWRPIALAGKISGYLAGTAYPSRAVDAAGRRGFLEKQLMAVGQDLPAAEAALLCLPAAAAWTDAVWWKHSPGQDWSKHDAALLLAEEPGLPACALAESLSLGLDALARLDSAVLQDFYARLLAGQRPACLHGLTEPLPPSALAALLLPLPCEQAGRLSLAGWVPSRRYDLEDLGRRWDVLVLPEPARPPAMSAQALAQMGRARLCARALQEKNPQRLAVPGEAGASRKPPRPASKTRLEETDGYHLNDASWPILPGARLTLSPPPAETEGFMRLLHDFAASVDRRALNPGLLKRRPELDAAQARQLCLWVKQAGQAPRPHYAEPRQWAAKLDLLRALACILAPSTYREENLPLPGGKSFLFYAPTLITKAGDFSRWQAAFGQARLAAIRGDRQTAREDWASLDALAAGREAD